MRPPRRATSLERAPRSGAPSSSTCTPRASRQTRSTSVSPTCWKIRGRSTSAGCSRARNPSRAVLYDESTHMSERDRERATEDLLRQLRTSAEAGPVGACLDPDVVAAWLDGGLSPDEVAAAEAHASTCARCQSLLAAVVRTEPTQAVPEPRWSWVRALRWAVPLTAAGAAVAIWIGMTPRGPSSP